MFKNIFKVGVFAALVMFFVSGCSYKRISTNNSANDEVGKEYNKVQVAKQHLEVAEDMQKNVTTQNTLESTISSLSTQIMQNRKLDTNKPVLITSFVRLDQFKKTTEIVWDYLLNAAPEWLEDYDYRLHPHNDLIKAYKKGAKIECKHKNKEWRDASSDDIRSWYEDAEYRIKPEPPKPREWMVSVSTRKHPSPGVAYEYQECDKDDPKFECVRVREIIEE